MPRKRSKVFPPPGFKLQHTIQLKTGLINQIAWSPDGEMYAFASTEGDTWLCDGNTGELCHPFYGHSDNVRCVEWSPDGKFLATGSDDKSIIIWDSHTFGVTRKLKDQFSSIHSLAWSPGNNFLAAGLRDGNIMLWNCESWMGKKMYDAHTLPITTIDAHTAAVTSLAWSPNGRMLASGSPSDSKICLWSSETERQRWKPLEDVSSVRSLAWSPNGRTIASGLADKTIKLWDAEKRRLLTVLKGHRGAVISVGFSSDGSLLASKALDNSVRFWRCDTWEMVAKLNEPSYLSASLSFSPRRPNLATLGDQQSEITVWELDLPFLLPARDKRKENLTAWAGDSEAVLALVFTDIVGSTMISTDLGNEMMRGILYAHFEQARLLIKKNRGFEVKTIGDSFMVVFRTAVNALNFMLALFEATGDERVRIRAAAHVVSVKIQDEDITGSDINYTKRVLGNAKGPEIWLSNRAYEDIKQESAKMHDRLSWVKHTNCELAGIPGVHTLWSVVLS